MSVAAAMLLVAGSSVPWTVEMIWGCKFSEAGRDDFLVQGRLVSRPRDNGGAREKAMSIVKDESGRFEGYVARQPYYVTPGPGEHWVIHSAGKKVGLMLFFPEGKTRGTAEMSLGDRGDSRLEATCEFRDRDV